MSDRFTARATPADFASMKTQIAQRWLGKPIFDRGEVHAQKVVDPAMQTRELTDVLLEVECSGSRTHWANVTQPNLPWAEDHFQERVGGVPLNPPPQEANWPFAQAGNKAHKQGELFSHTYPERFWPKQAALGGLEAYPCVEMGQDLHGIRFDYGDLDDLVQVLVKNPRSRQAYLPVWFPEDLTAAREGKRVPCTLGYHFMLHSDNCLHMTYHMRSCDIVRFMTDDIYMAGRLLQWVVDQIVRSPFSTIIGVGDLRMTISSLHAFEGDLQHMKTMATQDRRRGYNFEGLG